MKRIFMVALAGAMLASCGNNSNTSTGGDSTGTGSVDTASKTYTLEPVFMDSTYQFTGITKEEGGRLFISYPRWSPMYK